MHNTVVQIVHKLYTLLVQTKLMVKIITLLPKLPTNTSDYTFNY